MKTPAAAIDPRMFCPGCLPNTYPAERRNFGAVLIADLAHNLPPADYQGRRDMRAYAGQVWHRLRSKVVRDDGLTVEDLLSVPEISSPIQTIAEIAEAFLKARAEREHLVSQIAVLDSIEAAFKAAERQPATR